MTKPAQAPGASPADPGKLSIAALPYELQALVFEAAIEPQIIFMDITNNVLKFTRPADKALALACRLSREVYTRNKKLYKFGPNYYWINPEQDIFYLHSDDPVQRSPRPNPDDRLPLGDKFHWNVIQNVAVDLHYLGEHPRHDPLVRIWTLFANLRRIHVLVPRGPPGTPAPLSTPETLILSDIPSTQVVAAPGNDKELWLAVRYQVKKVCGRILATENGWMGRHLPDVVGHITGLRGVAGEMLEKQTKQGSERQQQQQQKQEFESSNQDDR